MWSYVEESAKAISRSQASLTVALANDDCQADLRDLGLRTRDLLTMLYGITRTDDDEILNWTLPDVATDLGAAAWTLAAGWYKTSASSLRSALDVAMVSLYFSIRERTDAEAGAYNRFFAGWDRGDRDTPNWGEMRPFISSQPTHRAFTESTGIDVIAMVYEHFKRLSQYTHSRQWERTSGDPIGAMWTGLAPEFDSELFDRFVKLARDTIGWIGLAWVVTLPEILDGDPLDSNRNRRVYENLLQVGPAVAALNSSRVRWASTAS